MHIPKIPITYLHRKKFFHHLWPPQGIPTNIPEYVVKHLQEAQNPQHE